MNERLDEIVIVAIAKMEYGYIKDWVEYHLKIGFDHIYIYDNNDIDSEEYYDDLLKEYINEGRVTIIDARGRVAYQRQSYLDFYSNYDFKWILVIDIDEFLFFNKKYSNIKDFLNNGPKDAESYVFQWRLYKGSKKDLSRPIWENNTEDCPNDAKKNNWYCYYNGWYKTITRKIDISLNIDDVTEHFISLNDNQHAYDGSYNKINNDLNIYFNCRLCLDDIVYIKHYPIRDIDTFYNKKLKRGHAGLDNSKIIDNELFLDNSNIYRKLGWYQDWNYYIQHQEFLTVEDQVYLKRRGFQTEVRFNPVVYINYNFNNYTNLSEFKDIYNDIISRMYYSYNLSCRINFNKLYKYYDPSTKDLSIDKILTSVIDETYDSRISYNNLDLPNYIFHYRDNKTYKNPLIFINMSTNNLWDRNDNYWNIVCDVTNPRVLNKYIMSIIDRDLSDLSSSYILVPRELVYYDESESGYLDICNKIRDKYDISNSRHIHIQGNFFMTTVPIYNRIVERFLRVVYEENLIINNDDIISSYNENSYNTYDLLKYILYDIPDEIILI